MDKFKTPIGGSSKNITSLTTGNFEDKNDRNDRNYTLTTPQNLQPVLLINDVTVYSWGRNEHGELGLGTKINTNTPQPVKQLKGMSVQHISTGGKHTVVLSEANVYVCGTDILGLLGLKHNQWRDFENFQHLDLIRDRAHSSVCAEFHTILLSSEYEVYAWGGTLHNKLGQSLHAGIPTQLNFFNTKKIIQVACGDYHSLALDISGNIYSWGGGGANYNRGQCGHDNTKDIETPKLIEFFNQSSKIQTEKPIMIACGGYHSIVKCQKKTLYGFGKSTLGQCGIGEFEDSYVPRLITFNKKFEAFEKDNTIENNDEKIRIRKEFAEDKNKESLIEIQDIKCGGNHTIMLSKNGRVYMFGHGINGQLGLGNTKNYCSPMLVKSVIKKKVIRIAAGWSHSMILTDLNNLYMTGCGKYGELGLGSFNNKKYFTHLKSIKHLNITEIYAGGHHSWIVLDSGFPKKLDYNTPSPLISEDEIAKNKTFYTPNALNLSAEINPKDNDLKSGKDKRSLTPEVKKNKPESLIKDTSLKFSMDLLGEKLLNSYNNNLVQIAYTDLKMSHRFIRFSLNQKHNSKLSQNSLTNLINDYLQGDSGVSYFRLQNDSEVSSFNNQALESMYKDMKDSAKLLDPNRRNSFSLTIVYDLMKNSEIIRLSNHLENISSKNFGKNKNMYDAVSLNEDDIINSEIEKTLSYWVLDFIKNFGEYTEKNIKFLELRPNIFLI